MFSTTIGRKPQYLFRRNDGTLMYVEYSSQIQVVFMGSADSTMTPIPVISCSICNCPCAYIEIETSDKVLVIDSESPEWEPTPFIPGQAQVELDEPEEILVAKWGNEQLEVLNLDNFSVTKIADGVRISM